MGWVAPWGVRHCILSMVGTGDSRSWGGMLLFSSTTSGVLKLILNNIQVVPGNGVGDELPSLSKGILGT